jgi:alkylation response protein AidB-like acyl-CoA dehydrogenase
VQLSLSADQQVVASSFADFFRGEVPTDRVRRAEPLGFDPGLWRKIVGVGAPGVAVGEGRGGGGGSLLDAALIAEQYGRCLTPAPLIEVSVAARLLERCRSGPAERELASVLDGDQIVTMALFPASSGVAAMVPWAAVADSVIVLVEGRLLLLRPGRTVARPGLGAEAPADVVIGDALSALELASGRQALDLAACARDDWRTLKSAALVGLAAEAVSLGIGYANQRQQFGRLIGSFQALAHGLVDVATAVDGARLLAYEAAWAIDHDRVRAEHLASMSMAFAADTAAKASARALHCHGGYGFTEEYDVQLYYRRARSWSAIGGTVHDELLHLASVLWPSPSPSGGGTIDEGGA